MQRRPWRRLPICSSSNISRPITGQPLQALPPALTKRHFRPLPTAPPGPFLALSPSLRAPSHLSRAPPIPVRPDMPAALIDVLLNLVPDNSAAVLSRLEQNPEVAAQRDAHGYSLLHAAASYGKLDLARALVQTYSVSVDITDEDGDTPLFAVENPDVAKFFVEELGADVSKKNEEGLTALDKMDDEGEFPLVAAYLRQKGAGNGEIATDVDSLARSAAAQETNGVHPPPPLPEGVRIQMGTMPEQPADEAPDPEFRRRIEELAAREDFQGEEGQRQLRELVQDAVSDMASDGRERDVRRRVEE